MLSLMCKNTCKTCYVPEEYVTDMKEYLEETPERCYPYTRIHIIDKKQNHDYYLDVVESAKYIKNKIETNKMQGEIAHAK